MTQNEMYEKIELMQMVIDAQKETIQTQREMIRDLRNKQSWTWQPTVTYQSVPCNDFKVTSGSTYANAASYSAIGANTPTVE